MRLVALLLFLAAPAPALARAQCPEGTPPPCRGAVALRPRIQVLDFESGDTAQAYLASGVAEDVRAALLGSHAVVVVGPSARRALADYVFSGTLRRLGDAVIVSCRLERARSGSVLWSRRLSRPWREFAGVATELASQTLRAVGVRRAEPAAGPRADPAIYDLFIRARYLTARRNESALSRAAALAREAIARDSTSPLGWVALANSLERAVRFHFPVAGIAPDSILVVELAAADRAAELAPDDDDVRLMRGRVAQDVDPTSRSASLRAFRAVLAHDSANGEAWGALGVTLLELGDESGSLAAFRRAIAADPASGEKQTLLAIALFYGGQYDSALAWADRAVESDPTLLLARAAAGQAALWSGHLEEAQAHFEAADRLYGFTGLGDFQLTRVLIARGDSAGARAYVARIVAHADTANPAVHVASGLADALLAVGDTARALWWLERYRPRRDLHFQMHLRVERAFDGVRALPRFRALVAP